MKPTAIVHIGTMKTGTTSIQKSLDQSGPWLAARNWRYLGWPIRNADLMEQRLATVAPGENVIISDEGIWHFAGDPRCDTKRIARLLSDFDVKVLVYFRRPDSFLESWFVQGLKHGTGSVTVPSFLASPFVGGGTSFLRRLQHFADVFGRETLHVASYERSQLFHGDAVLDFLRRAGLCDAAATHDALAAEGFHFDTSQNTTPNLDTMLLLSMMRQIAKPEEKRMNVIAAQLRAAQADTPKPAGGLLLPSEIAACNDKFRPMFRQIQASYGGGVAPDFFSSWPDPDKAEVCAMRAPYDQLMIRLGLQPPQKG